MKRLLTVAFLAVLPISQLAALPARAGTSAEAQFADGIGVEWALKEVAAHSPAAPPEAGGSLTQGNFQPTKNTTMPIHGRARLFRGERGRTKLSVSAGGLAPSTSYPTHLHVGKCADDGAEYRNDPTGAPEPPNELWASSDPAEPKAGLRTDPSGRAKGLGNAPWTARLEAQSVVIHSPDAGLTALACADLV